jgi:hypothetical protein
MENDRIKSFTKTMLEVVCDEVNNAYNINSQKNIKITNVLLGEYNLNNMIGMNDLIMESTKSSDIIVEIMITKTMGNGHMDNLYLMMD